MTAGYRRPGARADMAERKEALADAVLVRMVREACGTAGELLRAQANEAAARHALLVAALAAGQGPAFEAVAPQLRAALDRLEGG
jgi:hypothetical protein